MEWQISYGFRTHLPSLQVDWCYLFQNVSSSYTRKIQHSLWKCMAKENEPSLLGPTPVTFRGVSLAVKLRGQGVFCVDVSSGFCWWTRCKLWGFHPHLTGLGIPTSHGDGRDAISTAINFGIWSNDGTINQYMQIYSYSTNIIRIHIYIYILLYIYTPRES